MIANKKMAASPPAQNTRLQTTARIGTAAGAARVAKIKQQRRLTQWIQRMECKVQQAMAVMDTDTGKMLNFCQRLQSAKHKEVWSKSSSNKFGKIANGIGGQITGTNTIKFIHKHDRPNN